LIGCLLMEIALRLDNLSIIGCCAEIIDDSDIKSVKNPIDMANFSFN